jgi:hypothetical protein
VKRVQVSGEKAKKIPGKTRGKTGELTEIVIGFQVATELV